jgi:metal-dependent amidase/aminoacylase/carboxypeptidase family protein
LAAGAKKAADTAAPGRIDARPSLASEDFALYGEYVQSWFFWVGSRAEGEAVEELHRPRFHTDDQAMRQAAQLYAAAAMLGAEDLGLPLK